MNTETHPIATHLDEVYRVLSNEPLLTQADLDRYYVKVSVRGDDQIRFMERGVRRSHQAAHYKAFVAGHSGVGKSTEITRLIEKIDDQFRTIRFNVVQVLDPNNFKAFDVLLIMISDIVEQTLEVAPTSASTLSNALKEVWDWFASEKETQEQAKYYAAEMAGGLDQDSILAKVTGLFFTLKGEMKYAHTRKKETVTYRLRRLSQLVALANRVFDACNAALYKAEGKEWLIVGEEFDKPNVSVESNQDFFIHYASVIADLHTHLIFTIPIGLIYSEQGTRLPLSSDQIYVIPDIPVYTKDHKRHIKGRDNIKAILGKRMSPDLFAKGQMNRLIVASGGQLRTLFPMIAQAADRADLRNCTQIEKEDATVAIRATRTDYERRLGQSPYDPVEVQYSDKAERLVDIFNKKPEAEIPDSVLYSLLRANAVQEFNGERWFGVHPLVVDVLKKQKRLDNAKGGTI